MCSMCCAIILMVTKSNSAVTERLFTSAGASAYDVAVNKSCMEQI